MSARHARFALVFAAAAIIAVVEASPSAAGQIDKEGQEPWELCGLCHTYEGRSATAKFPRLAGQKPAYIVKQLEDFAAGRRENEGGQMRSIMDEVAVEDFEAIAAWFAQQDPAPPDAPKGDAALGAELWARLGCRSCHDPTQPPHRPLIPHLTAQHERYLAKQLLDYRSGARGNDVGAVMRRLAEPMTDDEIDALAAYLASTPRP